MMLRSVLLVAACAVLAACQSAPKPAATPAVSVGVVVPAPESEKWVCTELVFELAPYEAEGLGLAAAEGTWRTFLDEDVIPRFPEGVTVVDAYGQRRDNTARSGEIVRSRCRVLVIVHPDNAAKRGDIDAVREAYRARTGASRTPVIETAVSAPRF